MKIELEPKEQFDKRICEKYPKIFRERNLSMTQTCMCWGFDIGPGWFKIVEELCEQLQQFDEKLGIEIIASQVKEKFGTLRFYYYVDFKNSIIQEEQEQRLWSRIIDKCTNDAVHKTKFTCEICGEHGKVRNTTWVKTLCDEHFSGEDLHA